jgi:hypothetical protein
MHGARLAMQRLLAVQQRDGLDDISLERRSVEAETSGTLRTACSIDSMPQSPQPTGPAMLAAAGDQRGILSSFRTSAGRCPFRPRRLRSIRSPSDAAGLAGLLVIFDLPFDGPFEGETCTAVTLYSGQLVAQSEKSVVMTLACVVGMVEGGVDDARRDAVGDQRAQRRIAGAALSFTQSPSRMPRCSASCGWISSRSSMPDDILGAPCLRADIVLAEDAPGGEQQREARAGALVGRDIFGADELALAAHEAVDMHDRRAQRRLLVAGPLHRAQLRRA